MINALFLICALSLPAAHSGHAQMTESNQIERELKRLRDFIHKNNPDAEVFITPKGQADKLKEHGYEKIPFTWRDQEIWIQRKPRPDTRPEQKAIGVSA